MTEPTGPGYTEDPYNSDGEKVEGFFVGSLVNLALKPLGLSDPSGFCSTYREWHIMLAAINAGLRAGTFENIPDCPPLWRDEMQYWNMPAMVANIVKCQWPTVTVVLSGILVKYAGLI